MKKYNLLLFGVSICMLFSCKSITIPTPVLPVPTDAQVNWHKMETYAFIHFGLNTFNDLEWGYGNTPASTFNPTHLNVEQWVRTIQSAGLKGVILTAKHHDGFCLWPTETTDYSVKNSPWKNGKGDMVKELSDACHKHGIKFGIYLSPWDRNNTYYGKPEYAETFHSQMRELITHYGSLFEYWFDGANGGNGWYGGSNETRSIDAETYYQYKRACDTIRTHHPDIMIFGGTTPTIRWIGNEEGWAGDTQWSPYTNNSKIYYRQSQWGIEDGEQWLGGECDVSIRPGWFYHAREDHQVKSLSKLVDLYYRSVGHNSNFLLNFPVALNGKIPSQDSLRAVEWYRTIRNDMKSNLLKECRIMASNNRGNRFNAKKVNDSKWDTYWATEEGITQASLIFTFKQPTEINRLLLQEYIPLGQRVKSFTIETEQKGKWIPVQTLDSTTTIGYKRIVRFQTIKTKNLKICFNESRGSLCINNVEAYLAPALITEPIISRSEDNEVEIEAGDTESEIYYTTDGSQPLPDSSLLYKRPFVYAKKGTIKAIAYDPIFQKSSLVSIKELDISVENYQIIFPEDKQIKTLFDGNGYSAYYLPEGKQELEIRLKKETPISGFRYTPNQNRDAGGHIAYYQFFINDKMVSEGEFSNIKANPIEQVIRFTPTPGNWLRLVVTRITDEQERAGLGEFSVITD